MLLRFCCLNLLVQSELLVVKDKDKDPSLLDKSERKFLQLRRESMLCSATENFQQFSKTTAMLIITMLKQYVLWRVVMWLDLGLKKKMVN